jgi:Fic family protein
MKDLIKDVGRYRMTQVGVFKGIKVSHIAPSAKQVPQLMRNLFDFLKKDLETLWIIKACVFHYELEFIHPFTDGNGRMGRLWQQLILMKQSPIFEYISTETLVHKRQKEYYQILEKCDRFGDSTLFIEFSLENILKSLDDFTKVYQPAKPKILDRIEHALEFFGSKSFTRKDYLSLHKGLSTATASRDLAQAVKDKQLKKSGDKAQSVYSRLVKT